MCHIALQYYPYVRVRIFHKLVVVLTSLMPNLKCVVHRLVLVWSPCWRYLFVFGRVSYRGEWCKMRNTTGLDLRNSRLKNNLQTNRDSYGHSETTVGKLSKRNIQSRCVPSVSSFSAESCFGKSSIMDLPKNTHLCRMRLLETFPTVVLDSS